LNTSDPLTGTTAIPVLRGSSFPAAEATALTKTSAAKKRDFVFMIVFCFCLPVQIYGERMLKDVSCKETCFYLLNNDCGNVAPKKTKTVACNRLKSVSVQQFLATTIA
jgi:hypothetical protein